MIKIEETIIREITHHFISSEEHKTVINNTPFEFSNEEDESTLKNLLLKPFINATETFEFSHKIELNYNVLFNLANQVHEGNDFIEESKKIVQHLISSSKHPNIKDGELFIVKMEDVKIGDKYLEALGIFKFEEKDKFLESKIENGSFRSAFKKGIGNKKADKACLVLFDTSPFTILIIDSNKKETEYWQNEFIQLKSKNDDVNKTNNFLTITKNFIASQIPEEFEVTKTDQIDLLNRSVEYFKTKEEFDKTEFEEAVFADHEVIDSFRKFDQGYREEHQMESADQFEISGQVVKKQARTFKSVLKLDKNFHIYIHGNKELIEKGVDDDGRKFYKVYYQEEK